MRVTENMNYDTVRNTISRQKEKMDNLQTQQSTRKLNTPSDDPVGAAKVLEIRTEKVNNDQYQLNAHLAEAFLNNSDHTLDELADILVRAKEIAIGQASGASSNEDTRLGVAEEVTQMFKQAVAAANRRVGDRYLFGGYRTQKPPIDGEGRYVGDDGQMMVEVAKDVFISMNVPGIEAFNTQPKRRERYARWIPTGTTMGLRRRRQRRSLGRRGQEARERGQLVRRASESSHLVAHGRSRWHPQYARSV